MITIKEIASELGMSATTVSNVIRGKTKEVSPETIERVNRFLEEVDYIPNINARNLAQNHSNIIGVVLKTEEVRHTYMNILADPFVSEMLGGIEETVRKAGYFLMLYISDDINDIIRQISTWNVDGLLLFWMMDEDAIKISRKFKKPMAFIDTYMSKETIRELGDRYANIGLEDEQGTYDAVSYMVKLGHKKIGFLSDNSVGVDGNRYKGYIRALEDAGIKYKEEYRFWLDTTEEGIDESLEKLAKQAEKVTAIFCCSDNFAALMVNACERHGLHVPEDISIMGFDDILIGRLFRPPLTTMHQDIHYKGVLATSTLIDMIREKPVKNREIILKTRLIERESVSDIRKKKK